MVLVEDSTTLLVFVISTLGFLLEGFLRRIRVLHGVGSDGWPFEVYLAYDLLSLSSVVALGVWLIVAIFFVFGKPSVPNNVRRILGWSLVVGATTFLSGSFLFGAIVNANSDSKTPIRVWIYPTIAAVF